MAKNDKTIVYTIGYATHSLQDFIKLLKKFGIQEVIDIRDRTESGHDPAFYEDALKKELQSVGIGYEHEQAFTGFRRKPADNSVNTAWEDPSFRAFADHMQTPEFAQALDRCIKLAKQQQIALMCAESVPWRCHRRLIGDALTVHGIEVLDIYPEGTTREHELSTSAHVQGTTITYPGNPPTYMR